MNKAGFDIDHKSDVVPSRSLLKQFRFPPKQAAAIHSKLDSVKRLHILVSMEFDGLFKNGGIGTYFRQLARELNSEGETVIGIVVSAERKWSLGKSPLPEFRFMLVSDDAQMVRRPTLAERFFNAVGSLQNWSQWQSTQVFALIAALRNELGEDVDIVVEAHEMGGIGYLTTQASQTGILGNNFVTIIGSHSSEEWIRYSNRDFKRLSYDWGDAIQMEAERISLEDADVTFSPSNFLLDRLDSFGWDTSNAHVMRYPIPSATDVKPEQNLSLKLWNRQAVVFYGRIEERKGIIEFCEGIAALPATVSQGIEVILVGRWTQMSSTGMNSIEYARSMLEEICEFRVFEDLGRDDALHLIGQLDRPVVFLGSPEDNFPNAALEIAQLTCTIVSCRGSGLQEALEHTGCWEKRLSFEPHDSHGAGLALLEALQSTAKGRCAAKRLTQAKRLELNKKVMAQRKKLVDAELSRKKRSISKLPKITFLVTHFNLGEYLIPCLKSLSAQTYSNVEVLVIDDASSEPFSKATFSWAKRVFLDMQFFSAKQNGGLGWARNYLAASTDAKYIVPMDADNIADPCMAERLVQAGELSGADIVTAPMFYFVDKGTLPLDEELSFHCFLPGFVGSGFSENFSGDALSLFKRSVFLKYPHPEDPIVRAHDWILMTTAYFMGLKIALLPEIIGLYRIRKDSMMHQVKNPEREQYLHRKYISQLFDDTRLRRAMWFLLAQSAKVAPCLGNEFND
jgi:glycosyltransferase involved in cell wall biosynthesis